MRINFFEEILFRTWIAFLSEHEKNIIAPKSNEMQCWGFIKLGNWVGFVVMQIYTTVVRIKKYILTFILKRIKINNRLLRFAALIKRVNLIKTQSQKITYNKP